MSSTTSGRVRTRTSLQPSRAAPPKSAAVRSHCCSIVPIAPSSTRTRCAISSRKACSISLKFCIRRPEYPPDRLVVVVSKVVAPCGSASPSIPLRVTANCEHPYFTHLFPKNRTRVGCTECGGAGPLSPFCFHSILLPSLAPLFRRSFSPQNSPNRSVTIREHLPQSSLPTRPVFPNLSKVATKRSNSSKLSICLLSPHPLVLSEFERLLSKPEFKVVSKQLESTLAPDLRL